jgi:hypothetical protein
MFLVAVMLLTGIAGVGMIMTQKPHSFPQLLGLISLLVTTGCAVLLVMETPRMILSIMPAQMIVFCVLVCIGMDVRLRRKLGDRMVFTGFCVLATAVPPLMATITALIGYWIRSR